MAWELSQQDLEQVLHLLQNSQSADTEMQRNVQQRLDQLNGNPQFCCYLTHILAMRDQHEAARSLAGLILKNNIRLRWKSFAPEVKEFVRQKALDCIADPSPLIRATVGIIVTTIVFEENIASWPALLPTLNDMLKRGRQGGDANSDHMSEGALGALQKVFEDSGDRIPNEVYEEMMIPILEYFGDRRPKIRGMAMSCYNNILMINADPINPVIDHFLGALFRLAEDPDVEVQRQLCRSLCLLLDSHIDNLKPHLTNIIDFIIMKTEHPDESIALEACEFFLSLSESPEVCRPVLAPVLGKLLPVLIRCMKYSEADIFALKGNDEDDAMVPDRDEDIKPRFHKAKQMGGAGDSGLDGDDDDDDDDDSSTEWNIRRCSAASLDVLANIFKNDMLPELLPIISAAVHSDTWEVKESGILALGAIAEGCMSGIQPDLPKLIPFLLQMLNENEKPLVRSITCWTLSRYCSWVVDEANEFFEPLLYGLLGRILDRNKKVQEAACSAFASFEEEGGEYCSPYLKRIIETFVEAFKTYQAKNLLILYDACGTLATSVGREMVNEEYVNMLMPPLMEKWMKLNNEDKELFPLLECVSAIASASEQYFMPYAEPVYHRCIQLVERSVAQTIQATQNPNQYEMPDKDFLIVALDLLSGLAEGLGDQIAPLIVNSPIVQLLLACAMDTTAEVRQSSFALIGDLTKSCWDHIKPFVSTFIPVVTMNFDPTHVSVCNNAIWAFGEMVVRSGADIKPLVPTVLPYLIQIVNKQELQRTLLENTAISIGRLGIFCTQEVAPYLNVFIRNVCLSLRNIRDNSEKESAFLGLCHCINSNPQGLVTEFIFWCDAVASWQNPKPYLKERFVQIFEGFKKHMGDQHWSMFVGQFPVPLRERLGALYNL